MRGGGGTGNKLLYVEYSYMKPSFVCHNNIIMRELED